MHALEAALEGAQGWSFELLAFSKLPILIIPKSDQRFVVNAPPLGGLLDFGRAECEVGESS